MYSEIRKHNLTKGISFRKVAEALADNADIAVGAVNDGRTLDAACASVYDKIHPCAPFFVDELRFCDIACIFISVERQGSGHERSVEKPGNLLYDRI